MKKRGRRFQFNVNMSNRLYYTLILIGILIIGGWVVYALTPGIAPNPGHTLSEVAPPAGCSNNQFLQWNATSGSWNCANIVGSGTGLGAWELRAERTDYLANTDGFVLAWQGTDLGCWVIGVSDSNNPPTTTIIQDYSEGSITMPVRRGDYWRADFSCGAVTGMHVWWIPLS